MQIHERLLLWSVAMWLGCWCCGAQSQAAPASRVSLGVDIILTERIDLLRGKRVGLLTNASGVDADLVATADRFARDGRFRLVRLFSPEHGLRGATAAGRAIADSLDPFAGVMVESLFGPRRAPQPDSFKEMDVLVFDIQDVGSRAYTYISTMGEAMVAAAKAHVPFIVLDRPNPQGGLLFEGAIRLQAHQSFVSWGPIPVTHGMTVGELARFYNGMLKIGCDLQVVTMKGWTRSMLWQDTGLAWVPTSPGISHLSAAQLYVATGMVGGVTNNINEGVGTALPFETIAAEFIQPQAFAAALQQARLAGLRFRPTAYRPYYGRFKDLVVHGVQLIVDDPRQLRPLHTALTILTTIERLYPGQMKFRNARSTARIWGNKDILRMVKAGKDVDTIERTWAADTAAFAKQRQAFLLYP